MQIYLQNLTLIVILLLATISDLRTQRIPNILSIGGTVLGLSLAISGLSDLRFTESLIGVFVGFVSFLPFYAGRTMGAGDVKLMMAVGAFVGGPALALGAVAGSLIAGGVLGLGYLAVRRGLRRSLRRYATEFKIGVHGGGWKGLLMPEPGVAPLRFPYAAAIAVGATSALVFADFWHQLWSGAGG